MTRLFNDPAAFPQELLEGFVAAYPDIVMGVPGGVIRSTHYDGVAVIAGGGSGHYPAFCGLVGQGLAHGAAMGNLFSSPSAHQAYSVGRAANRGKGVIFSFGNYAGDVLHFGEAAERLEAEGIPTRIVAVTDDVASAPKSEIHKRRGIAGDLTVFKIAGAAADAGYSLDDVVGVAERANERTRSLGVAFGGCTMPGASEPLFTVPMGMMSVGLGIHGEPGISEQPVPTADELAELFVSTLLADVPENAGTRATVLLNGLGTVKYEELFVVYRRVNELLTDAGVTIVSPDLGELCTSLDMAGASLTLFWLDDELESLWTSPSNAAGYRKGAALPVRVLDAAERSTITEYMRQEEVAVVRGSDESRAAASIALDGLRVMTQSMISNADELGRIDAVAGDGDHGVGMERGTRAALAAAEAAHATGAGVGTMLDRAGTAWSDLAGGTSGALWGTALRAVGDRLGDSAAVTSDDVIDAITRARIAIMSMGKASVGDKTMVDVLVPYTEALALGAELTEGAGAVFVSAAGAAADAAESTKDLLPRIGRARPLAAKSLGTPDAGATSLALVIAAVTELLVGSK